MCLCLPILWLRLRLRLRLVYLFDYWSKNNNNKRTQHNFFSALQIEWIFENCETPKKKQPNKLLNIRNQILTYSHKRTHPHTHSQAFAHTVTLMSIRSPSFIIRIHSYSRHSPRALSQVTNQPTQYVARQHLLLTICRRQHCTVVEGVEKYFQLKYRFETKLIFLD